MRWTCGMMLTSPSQMQCMDDDRDSNKLWCEGCVVLLRLPLILSPQCNAIQ